MSGIPAGRGLRVLFPFVGDTVGGSHISALELMRELPNLGVTPVVGIHEHGPLSEFMHKEGVDWVKLPSVRYAASESLPCQLFFMFANSAQLAKQIHACGVELVHTNDRRMHLTWLVAARRARVPHVWHERTSIRSRRIALYSTFANRVVTISNYIRENAPPRLRDRAVVVENPVNCRVDEEQIQGVMNQLVEECPSSANNHKVVWVGNWIERKRPMLVIRIAEILCKTKGYCVTFIMLGRAPRGAREKFVECARERGIDRQFLFRDFERPIEPWIAAADVLLATAVREGLGRTVIEAMQVGTAVVASDDGGHSEIIENGVTGDLVRPDSTEEFAEAIGRLLDDESRRSDYVSRAGNAARRRYAPATHGRRILNVYESLTRTDNGESRRYN